MSHVNTPSVWEAQIIRENGIDPNCVGVTYRDADTIRLICYITRDYITINRGDRKW